MNKSSSFTAALSKHVAVMLGMRHITTAARCSRSNGQAEACVKRLCEHLKYYARGGLSIEQVLPICELNVRCMPHSKIQISPFAIVHGYEARLDVPGDAPPLSSDIEPDRLTYYRWFRTELQRLHRAVKEAREEQKQEDKRVYDKEHNVREPK